MQWEPYGESGLLNLRAGRAGKEPIRTHVEPPVKARLLKHCRPTGTSLEAYLEALVTKDMFPPPGGSPFPWVAMEVIAVISARVGLTAICDEENRRDFFWIDGESGVLLATLSLDHLFSESSRLRVSHACPARAALRKDNGHISIWSHEEPHSEMLPKDMLPHWAPKWRSGK